VTHIYSGNHEHHMGTTAMSVAELTNARTYSQQETVRHISRRPSNWHHHSTAAVAKVPLVSSWLSIILFQLSTMQPFSI